MPRVKYGTRILSTYIPLLIDTYSVNGGDAYEYLKDIDYSGKVYRRFQAISSKSGFGNSMWVMWFEKEEDYIMTMLMLDKKGK